MSNMEINLKNKMDIEEPNSNMDKPFLSANFPICSISIFISLLIEMYVMELSLNGSNVSRYDYISYNPNVSTR